jgi:RNA polymerase sigma factor (TIGR02999 family)
MAEVTHILSAIEQGDSHAAERLLPLVYDELRRLAAQKLAQEKPGQTLQATALVHEAYLRLVGGQAPTGSRQRPKPWDSRGHFFAAAAEAMRRILVENARRKRSRKHGGGLVRHDLDDVQLAAPELGVDLLALDDALDRLAQKDPMKAELVKLRHFAALTIDEAALALGISTTTANRYWAYARAWLHQEIARGAGATPPRGEKDQE